MARAARRNEIWLGRLALRPRESGKAPRAALTFKPTAHKKHPTMAGEAENSNPQTTDGGAAAMEIDEPSASKMGGARKDETQLPWVEKYRPKRYVSSLSWRIFF